MLPCPVPCRACSFANGRAWVLDTGTNTWKGYKLSFVEPPKPKRPPPVAIAAAPGLASEADKESCPMAVE